MFLVHQEVLETRVQVAEQEIEVLLGKLALLDNQAHLDLLEQQGELGLRAAPELRG